MGAQLAQGGRVLAFPQGRAARKQRRPGWAAESAEVVTSLPRRRREQELSARWAEGLQRFQGAIYLVEAGSRLVSAHGGCQQLERQTRAGRRVDIFLDESLDDFVIDAHLVRVFGTLALAKQLPNA